MNQPCSGCFSISPYMTLNPPTITTHHARGRMRGDEEARRPRTGHTRETRYSLSGCGIDRTMQCILAPRRTDME